MRRRAGIDRCWKKGRGASQRDAKRREEAWEDEAISDVNRISICSIIFLCCRPSLALISLLYPPRPHSLPPLPAMDPAFSSWPTGTTDHPPQYDSIKERQKKPRHRHSAFQLAALNQLYERNEHPSLEDRTNLAEKIGMYVVLTSSSSPLSYDSRSIRLRETKTVNAWFQNKRAANKKRSRPGQSLSTHDLPPISSLLSPVDSSVATPAEDPSIPQVTSPSIPRSQAPSTRTNPTQSSPEASKQQTAFYAGNPEHDHTYESSVPVPPSRPRMRMRPSQSQTEELRKAYIIDPHPTKEQREELGKRIGMYAVLPCLSAYSI